METDITVASKGMFKVIEWDMWAVDGLSGGPEECCTIVGNYKFLWLAKLAAKKRKIAGPASITATLFRLIIGKKESTRFNQSVYNDKGEELLRYVF